MIKPGPEELLVKRLRARIEVLEATLEPFSDIDGEDSVDYPDDTKCTVKFGRCIYYPLTLGDLRRARAALEKDTGK